MANFQVLLKREGFLVLAGLVSGPWLQAIGRSWSSTSYDPSADLLSAKPKKEVYFCFFSPRHVTQSLIYL